MPIREVKHINYPICHSRVKRGQVVSKFQILSKPMASFWGGERISKPREQWRIYYFVDTSPSAFPHNKRQITLQIRVQRPVNAQSKPS
jgi:hypothetical protein